MKRFRIYHQTVFVKMGLLFQISIILNLWLVLSYDAYGEVEKVFPSSPIYSQPKVLPNSAVTHGEWELANGTKVIFSQDDYTRARIELTDNCVLELDAPDYVAEAAYCTVSKTVLLRVNFHLGGGSGSYSRLIRIRSDGETNEVTTFLSSRYLSRVFNRSHHVAIEKIVAFDENGVVVLDISFSPPPTGGSVLRGRFSYDLNRLEFSSDFEIY